MRFRVLHDGSSTRSGQIQDFDADVVTVGRSQRNVLAFDATADKQVSGRHGEFVCVDGYLTYRDVGSTNGSLLNGSPVASDAIVRKGDVVQLGKNGPLLRLLEVEGADEYADLEATMPEGDLADTIPSGGLEETRASRPLSAAAIQESARGSHKPDFIRELAEVRAEAAGDPSVPVETERPFELVIKGLGGVLVAVLLGVLYQVVLDVNPLIKLNMLVTAGAGFLAGVVMVTAVTSSGYSSLSLKLLFASLGSLLALAASHLFEFHQVGYELVQPLGQLFDDLWVYLDMRATLGWEVSGTSFDGSMVWIAWGVEIVGFVGPALISTQLD